MRDDLVPKHVKHIERQTGTFIKVHNLRRQHVSNLSYVEPKGTNAPKMYALLEGGSRISLQDNISKLVVDATKR